MVKYTEDMHAKSLIKVLEHPNTCERCPGGNETFSDCCPVCRKFIGLHSIDPYMATTIKCPCNVLDSEVAAKYSWIALEAKGYLK